MKRTVRVLAIGDIVGRSGRNILNRKLQGISIQHKIDLVIANGENASGGRAITPNSVRDLFSMGVNIITTGNHVWDNNEILKIINNETQLLRPANYPEGADGYGFYVYDYKGIKICVINLMGRVQMTPIDCPFRKFDEIYSDLKDMADIIIVDFHAEATSEKKAFGWYVDGRASAVFGTHTHVQTSDEEILPGGTGYITDIGMTGAFDSVIGMDKKISIQRFLTQTKVKFEVATGNLKINGVVLDINVNGKTDNIYRIIE